MRESIATEHERLIRQTDELRREHESLHARPKDLAGHREHRARLQRLIGELQAHVERLHREERG